MKTIPRFSFLQLRRARSEAAALPSLSQPSELHASVSKGYPPDNTGVNEGQRYLTNDGTAAVIAMVLRETPEVTQTHTSKNSFPQRRRRRRRVLTKTD